MAKGLTNGFLIWVMRLLNLESGQIYKYSEG